MTLARWHYIATDLLDYYLRSGPEQCFNAIRTVSIHQGVDYDTVIYSRPAPQSEMRDVGFFKSELEYFCSPTIIMSPRPMTVNQSFAYKSRHKVSKVLTYASIRSLTLMQDERDTDERDMQSLNMCRTVACIESCKNYALLCHFGVVLQ